MVSERFTLIFYVLDFSRSIEKRKEQEKRKEKRKEKKKKKKKKKKNSRSKNDRNAQNILRDGAHAPGKGQRKEKHTERERERRKRRKRRKRKGIISPPPSSFSMLSGSCIYLKDERMSFQSVFLKKCIV